jgi:hypothetical protein
MELNLIPPKIINAKLLLLIILAGSGSQTMASLKGDGMELNSISPKSTNTKNFTCLHHKWQRRS